MIDLIATDGASVTSVSQSDKRFNKEVALWRVDQQTGYVYLISVANGLKLYCSPTGAVKLKDGLIGVNWRMETVLGEEKYNR